MQTSADHPSRWRHVSRMTDEKGDNWFPSGMSKVRSWPKSLVGSGRLFHACPAATGKARSPGVARQVALLADFKVVLQRTFLFQQMNHLLHVLQKL